MQILDSAREALVNNNSEHSLKLLLNQGAHYENSARYWQLLAECQEQEQQYIDAHNSWKNALSIEPNNQKILFAFAKLSMQTGRPSSHLFEQLLTKNKLNEDYLIGHAHSLALEQKPTQALESLTQQFSQKKPNKNLLKLYADILLLQSGPSAVVDFYKQKIHENVEVVFCFDQLIHHALSSQNHEQAIDFIGQANKKTEHAHNDYFLIKKAIILSEQKRDQEAFKTFQAVTHCQSVEKDIAIMRMSLRLKQLEHASAIAMYYAQNGFASTFIPYLSLIWRLQKSPFQQWLEQDNQFIKSYDAGLTVSQINELSNLLLRLHDVSNPYLEQSVRRGTQTDLVLFSRQESIIQNLVELIKPLIVDYIRNLPSYDATHPLLAPNRDSALQGNIKFSGSWSVKLSKRGQNVPHTHPKGWISSALYLQVPDKNQLGPAPNGYLQFGTPPSNLELELEHYHQEAPKPGKLVLFPSTTWHQTQPFNEGQRLVIAFDIKPPEKKI